MEINAHKYVLPLQAGRLTASSFVIRAIVGSSFSIGGGYFLTCNHALDNIGKGESIAIGAQNDRVRAWEAISVEDFERHEGSDIAILKITKEFEYNSRKWSDPKNLPMSSSVHATGYPFALNNPDEGSIHIRAFSGIISSKTIWSGFAARPNVYELSFQAPRGLSGAPLCLGNYIVGVVFGNRAMDMIVFSEKELNKEGNETTIYEKVESYRIGMALQASSVFDLESKLLGGTIGDHIRNCSLI